MLTFDRQLIDKYNIAGPRYTSYPPATFFHEGYTNNDLLKSVQLSNDQKPENVSVYVHIPFCPQLCTFCGCTTYTGMGNNVIETYIEALIKEIELVSKHISKKRPLTQIHWGGGTPNAIEPEFIARVTNVIKANFNLAEHYEMAMECSPAYLDYDMVDHLAELGFNRISLGIQDFNQKVLTGINRRPAKIPVDEMIEYLRSKGFKGINLDLVYGLPFQTEDTFKETVQQAIEANPDRLVTFSYAHIPSILPKQKLLEQYGLPSPQDKMTMIEIAFNMAMDAGYVPIGMDHFARPDDEFVIAHNEKKLHRNFQGYCTRLTTGQVYAFGTSSITQLNSAYAQNEKTIHKYIKRINEEGLAVVRGYQLTNHEQIVRNVINDLMCNYYCDFNKIAIEYNTTVEDVHSATGNNTNALEPFINDNLVEITNNQITVKGQGRYVIRNIAMVFDPSIKKGIGLYSKTM